MSRRATERDDGLYYTMNMANNCNKRTRDALQPKTYDCVTQSMGDSTQILIILTEKSTKH